MTCLHRVAAAGLLLAGGCFNPDPPGNDTDSTSGESADATSGPTTDLPTTDPDPSPTDTTTTDPDPTTATDDTGPVLDSSSGDPPATCGDGSIDDGEACDDANADDGDGCSSSCALEDGFGCEGQPSTCTAICGDGLVLGDEDCDDGNPDDGDGCTACTIDDGFDCTGEPSVCVSIGCGNGMLDGPEACDDGNLADGDGCASDCTVELYSRCIGEGPGSCAPIRILFAPADSDDVAFRAEMEAITGGPTAYIDAGNMTPTLADLQASYDCVHTFPNQTYANPMVFGDTLAAFVDGGGVVVLGIVSHLPQAGLAGSAITGPMYSPVTSVNLDFLQMPTNYAGDGVTEIHQGVAAYGTPIIDTGVMLQGMGVQESTYDNGAIASAYRPDFGVVYLNGTGSSVIAGTGDWSLLSANACAVAFVQ